MPLQGEEHTTAYHDEVSNRIAVQLTFMQSLEFNCRKKIANIRQIQRDGISAIKFEAARVHFLVTFSIVTVAVVVA